MSPQTTHPQHGPALALLALINGHPDLPAAQATPGTARQHRGEVTA